MPALRREAVTQPTQVTLAHLSPPTNEAQGPADEEIGRGPRDDNTATVPSKQLRIRRVN